MHLGLGLFLGGQRGGAQWRAETELFASGEVGGYYDVDRGAYQEYTSPATPVSTGSYIGYITDQSPNTKHLAADANNTTRPTLRTVGGVNYAETDALDDQLSVAFGVAFSQATIAYVFNGAVAASGRGIASIAASTADYMCIDAGILAGGFGATNRGSTAVSTNGVLPVAGGGPQIAIAKFGAETSLRIVGSSTSNVDTSLLTHIGSSLLYLGKIRQSGLFGYAQINKLLVVNRVLTGDETTKLINYWS